MRTNIKFLSQDQLKKLEQYFRLHRHESIRIALVELMYNTGCRPDELIRIRLKDIDKETRKATIHKGSKGSNPRVCSINEELAYLLWDMAMRACLSDYDPIFKSIGSDAETKSGLIRILQRQWDKIRAEIFIGDNVAGIYCLRHTWSKKLYDQKPDIRFLQLAMGHKSVSSTAHYLTHITLEESQLLFEKMVKY